MGDIVDLGAKRAPEGEEQTEGQQLTIAQAITLGKYHVRSFADVAEVLGAVAQHLVAEDQANAAANLADVRFRPLTACVINALNDLDALRVDRV